MIDWKKVTNKPEVIELIKLRELIDVRIRSIDKMAFVNYELEMLNAPQRTDINKKDRNTNIF